MEEEEEREAMYKQSLEVLVVTHQPAVCHVQGSHELAVWSSHTPQGKSVPEDSKTSTPTHHMSLHHTDTTYCRIC